MALENSSERQLFQQEKICGIPGHLPCVERKAAWKKNIYGIHVSNE